MIAHPDSPRAMADRLGLGIDLSRYMCPGIVGPTGKRHYYKHGGGPFGRYEAMDVLRRLDRLRDAKRKEAGDE